MGDIFGGNAFQLCIFLLADLLAGRPVLPGPGSERLAGDAWVIMTMVYAAAVVIRPERRRARLGPDSLLALAVFFIGIAGLFFVPHY